MRTGRTCRVSACWRTGGGRVPAPCVYFHIDGIKVPANRGGDRTLDDSVHMTADEAIRLATALLTAAGEIERLQ
jgi:hypothetical protein